MKQYRYYYTSGNTAVTGIVKANSIGAAYRIVLEMGEMYDKEIDNYSLKVDPIEESIQEETDWRGLITVSLAGMMLIGWLVFGIWQAIKHIAKIG